MRRFFVAAFLVLLAIFAAAAQTSPANDIFTGTVTASSSDAVTVVRKLPAKPDESKVFVVDKDTKIEGTIGVNARVTVHFKDNGDGAVHALRIIVRTDVKAPGGATKTPPGRK